MSDQIICSVAGCGNKAHARTFCGSHYGRWRKHGCPTHGGPLKSKRQGCAVDGCENKHCGYGYCQNHMIKWKRYGDPEGSHPRWKIKMKWMDENKNYLGDDCLKWPFATGDHGRGTAWVDGKEMSAPRAMCIYAHGEPPSPEFEATHSCGMGHEGCMNPRHLRWATKAENAADRIAHGTERRGTQINTNKLSEDDVREIRRRRVSETGVSLAREFGVSTTMICDIHKRRSWTWLD